MTDRVKTIKKTKEQSNQQLRKLEQIYMKEQRGMEENHLAQQTSWLLNNTYICFDGASTNNNDNNKKHFLQN